MLAQAEILRLLLFPTFTNSNKPEVLSENETTEITFRIRKILISYWHSLVWFNRHYAVLAKLGFRKGKKCLYFF